MIFVRVLLSSFVPEPIIRVGVLGVVGFLLDSNAVLGGEEEYTTENEERLFDVPIRMLADINQQVRPLFISVRVILPPAYHSVDSLCGGRYT